MAVPGGMPSGKAAKKPRVVKKAVVKAPSPVALARAQEQGYASQGKAVAKVADRQERARQRAEDLQHAAAQHDILTAQDIQKRDAYEKAHPVGSEYAKYVPGYKKGLAKAQGGGVFGELTGLNVKKALDNIPSDTAEIAVTTPSSVAKLSSTLVHHPTKVPGMLVEPYKQLVKDPKNFIENHPVSAGLMLSPAARMPGLAVGRVARIAGKQTLERTAATLPGTALKEARTGSRDFTIRAMQARRDAKTGTPVTTAKPVFHANFRGESSRRANVHYGTEKAAQDRVAHRGGEGEGAGRSVKTKQRYLKRDARVLDLTSERYAHKTRLSKSDIDLGNLEAGKRWSEMSSAQRAAQLDRTHGSDPSRAAAEATFNEWAKNYKQAKSHDAIKYINDTEDPGSTSYMVLNRKALARRAARGNDLTMTAKQIQRRTDEFFDVGQKHKQRVAISAKKEGQRRFADLPKAERKVALQEHVSGAKGAAQGQVDKKFAEEFGSTWVNQPRAPAVRIRKVGEQKITVAHKVPPKAEYIAGRPKPARGTPDPTVEALSENIKPGKPGVAIESEHVRMVDPQTKAPVGFGRELPGSKVVVARDAQGKPIGVLKMILDQHDKPSVMEVAVDPAHRGKGIATSLVRTAHEAGYNVEAAAREGGLTEAGAALVHKNLAARATEEPRATLHVGRYATEVTPRKGTVTLKKSGGKGVLHDNKADADAIAARVPYDATVKQVGEKYAVVPRVAVERLYGGGKAIPHRTVGTSGAIGAKVLRTAGKSFRTAVLPLSAKWLFGQAGEAGLRSVVAGAGPTSLLRESRVFKELERQQPGKGIEMRQRTSSGGQFGLQGTAREFANGRTLAQEFEGTGLEKPANALTKGAAAPGIRHVRRGFRAYSHVVFNVVNDAIEKTAQRAMTGRALKQGPLMDHRIIGLSDKAIHEAAQGLKATENQVALGRAVDRMYGQYSKFSPGKRETLLHTTPFYPWYRNVVTFLTKVLPVDHPVLTGLIASTNVLEEDWRKKHGLSLLDPNHKPGFLLGSYPAKGGKVTRLSRYTPFGATAEPLQGVADLAVPQFAGIRDNLKGLDWTGKPLKGNPLSNAGLTAAETHIPGVAQVDRITGLGDKYVRKLDKPTILSGKDLKAALLKEVNPLMAAGAGSSSSTGPAVKVAPVRVKPVRVKPIRIKPVKVR